MSTVNRRMASGFIISIIAIFMMCTQARSAEPCSFDSTLASSRGVAAKETQKTKSVRVESKKTSDDGIELGKQYLSKQDLDKVMKWIASQVAAERLPLCWKNTKTRKGVPLTSQCPEGTEKNGQLCYAACKAGYKGNGPVCWKTCPDGFTDIGGHCQKPGAIGRGAGYAIWDKKKCEDNYSQGCEQNAAMWYPKCPANFHAVGSNICSPDCPTGWTDSGTGCTKPSYGRGAGETLSCPEGTEKNGLLCYPACGATFKGVGPVCWQQCPSDLPFECAAACTKDKRTCISKTTDMVIAAAKAALSLASMGGESAVIKNLEQMTDILGSVKETVEGSNGLPIVVLDPNGQPMGMTKVGGSYFKPANELGERIMEYANMFSEDFEVLTSPEIAEKIDAEFSEGAAAMVKREWGIRHLALTMQANGFKAAKDLLWLVSFGDPTGLAAVAETLTNPKCGQDMPFPEVTELQ